jgi:hypothetical protein
MSILITILVIIVSIVALVLIIALFMKKEYTIIRAVTINKPKQDVFNYIKYIKNQDNYSVWVQIDPGMKREYSGTDGTVGFVSAWDSTNKKAGKGEQEIKGIKEGERVDLGLHFIKPFEGRSDAYLITESAAGNQTKVTWGLDGKMAYPMNIMLPIMNMEKLIGKDLETGLSNLKAVLEQK